MTRMQQENNRVLNTVEETTVATVINLYDKGFITNPGPRRAKLTYVLNQLGMSAESVNYWLDYFKV